MAENLFTQSQPSLIQDPNFQEEAERLQEEYLAQEGRKIPRAQVLPPKEATDPVVDITNILFGDLGKALGVTLDQKGIRWTMETAKEAWTEHPIRSAIEIGINAAPFAFGALKYTRASKIAGVSDDTLKAMDLIDEGADLANISDDVKDIARGQVYHLQRKRDLQDKIDSGLATTTEQTQHFLEKKFGNSYMEAVDPTVSAEHMNQWVQRFKTNVAENDTFKAMLRSAPPDEFGPQIAQYFHDPEKLSTIPKQYQPWAMQMADELRGAQSQMLKEGLISAEEVEKVGPVWFSLVREGTANTDIGATTTVLSVSEKGKTKLLSIPKTYSPNLLNRSMSKSETGDFLLRREAAAQLEKGNKEGALNLLQDKKYDSAKELINRDESFNAVKLLTADGKVNLSPKSLTINSLGQQKALIETYRYVRDIAIKYGKRGDELTPEMKNRWKSLDSLFGSDRIRRMVGVSKGLDTPVDELGFVPTNVFKEIESITGNSAKGSSVMDMLNIATALHKTSKTAFSPGSHVNNVLGNAMFLWNAGVNPLAPEFFSTQRKAWTAIRGLQQAQRSKGSIDELGDLGKLKSRVGNKEISLADELNSKEVENLIEKSSLLSEEGINTINRMTEAAASGSATKFLGTWANKISKTTRLDKMADVYMAEDGAMKFAYYLHLRQNGLSRRGAMLEVGRRLPMYNTIGETWKGMRYSFQPWITFPVEATRILKNNLMDYPLRTAMMLQVPHFLQAGSYVGMQALGRGQSYETINDRKGQLAQWATRPSSIMTPWVDRNGDFRHATLDFLPYTAVFPESSSKDAPFFQKTPIFREPMPVLSGMYYAMTGKDAWGREIPSDTLTDKFKNSVVNTAAFLAPPLVDKYMLNPTDPTMFYRFHQDLGRYPNQFTDKEGDPLFDMFFNNLGIRSYPSSPEQAIANENFKKKDLDAYQARLSKEASGLLKIGDTAGAGDKLSDVYQLMLEKYADPAIARNKFNDFIKRFRQRNKSTKVMQGLSLEQLDREIDLNGPTMAYESASAREEYIKKLKAERANRKHSSGDGNFNPLFPDVANVRF